MEKVSEKAPPGKDPGHANQRSADQGGASLPPPPFRLSAGKGLEPNGRGIDPDASGDLNVRWTEGCSKQGQCNASATGVSLGASSPYRTANSFGITTPITVHGSNLADVLDSELVSPSLDHTGSYASHPAIVSSNSSWMPADNIPPDNHGTALARALDRFDNHGGAGSLSYLQMDLYKIPSCGINTPTAMPHSGYRITHRIESAGGRRIRAISTKTAEAVTLNGYSTTPGLTASRREENMIRA